jgi:cytochrome b subunit of formate dehydrogenase
MMSHEDPSSPVFASRIADTCRSTQCHPGADVSLAATGVHLDLPTSAGTLEYLVAAFFIVITILTFGPSAGIVMLELLQLVVGRHRPGHHRVQHITRALMTTREGRLRLRRFTVNQRVQHWVLALLFTVLALTGFPMKFADQAWAAIAIDLFGGLGAARMIHHWSGIALVIGFAAHMIYAGWTLLKEMAARRREGRPIGFIGAVNDLPMWMSPVDFRKAGHLLSYLLLLRPDPPTFGRFSVKEKFEYIGVFWGTTLLGLTGMMLWGEQMVSHFLGGRWFNIAAIAHTYEAFLAVIHVGILHIVNVMFQPNVFPLSRATLTGNTPTAEMAEGHSEMVEAAAKELGIAAEGVPDA